MSTYFETKEEVKNFLDDLKIKNYTINDDLTVDVKGNVEVSKSKLKFIPVEFGKIEGDFEWIDGELISVHNFPYYAYNVDIHGNKIIDYLNMDIDNYFNCQDNPCVLFYMENERTECETDYHNTDFRNIVSDEDEEENNKSYLNDIFESDSGYDDYDDWYNDMGYIDTLLNKYDKESEEYFERIYNK